MPPRNGGAPAAPARAPRAPTARPSDALACVESLLSPPPPVPGQDREPSSSERARDGAAMRSPMAPRCLLQLFDLAASNDARAAAPARPLRRRRTAVSPDDALTSPRAGRARRPGKRARSGADPPSTGASAARAAGSAGAPLPPSGSWPPSSGSLPRSRGPPEPRKPAAPPPSARAVRAPPGDVWMESP